MNKLQYGYAGKILWINLTSGEIRHEKLPEELKRSYLGQSGVNAKLLYDLTDAATDPLGPDNPLIIGVGPLGGTLAPCSGRYTVTALSPLTGIFGDSNSGGHFGPELKYAGYDHLVITGKAPEPVYIWINDDTVKIKSAALLWGKTTWETEREIKLQLGQDTAQVASIGPAGENLVKFAAIINNLCRAAARTGMGAVMGSKNLKAIAVKGTRGITVKDPDKFLKTVHKCEEDILNDPMYEVSSTLGTTAITGLAQMLGFLPTKNFQLSAFEEAESLRGEILLQKYATKHKGCFNCAVSCSRFYKVTEGEYAGTVGEGPEYESISALASKCGNSNLPSVLKANTLCNQLGLDTISTGNVIAWAMECFEKGIIKTSDLDGESLNWGNHQMINKVIDLIAHRRGIGDLLAEGSYHAATKIGGLDFVIHSKGMDYPAVDVRGTKGMALSFAVSPRGGDHLKGLPLYEVAPEIYKDDIKEELGIEITPEYWKEYSSKAKMMIWHENWHCIVDSLGLCKLEGIALKPLKPKHFRDLLAAGTGLDMTIEELELIGERIWNLERLIGIRTRGINRQHDLPPRRLMEEPIANGPNKGERLSAEDYNKMLDEYYQRRGWSMETGYPTLETLKRLGIENERN
ncbi:aldehyde ferredoxin oxidoreductase family protein [Desulfitibacter alkalitolerans]|uniref:aldehyde ferredoxin oxidoreductase family protein n=1 Tax=Desulfitibacter alkalitolerans TaxID=264641 RepID=UPI000488DADD|nr:aldehyde ferredoxin oxidoreductase family protein [Desulfitibacter alkalitolerans]